MLEQRLGEAAVHEDALARDLAVARQASRAPVLPAGPAAEMQVDRVTAAAAALPEQVWTMTKTQLEAWVVRFGLQDAGFQRLVAAGRRTKEEWVAYVKDRAGLA
jgi:hypothetical protein